MQKFLREKGKIDKRINNVSCTFAYFYVRILLFEIRYVVERRNRSSGRGKETEIERDREIAGVAVARQGATGSEPILLWPARCRDSKGRWATNANRWSRMEKEIERRSRWFVIRGTEPGRSFLLRHSTRCTRLPDASRRQRLLQAPRVRKIGGNCAPTSFEQSPTLLSLFAVGDEIRMDDLEGEAEKGSWRKLSWQVTLKIVYRIDVANFRLVYFNFSNLKYTFETILGWLSLIIILMNYWYLQSRRRFWNQKLCEKKFLFQISLSFLLNFSQEREVNKHRV